MRIAIFALLPVTCLALDLTPKAAFKEQEGFKIPVIAFDDSGRTIHWRPPSNWRMTHENGILSLSPKNRSQASMILRVITRNAGDRELLGQTESLLAYCSKLLPNLSQNLTYRGTSEGAFSIGERSAREYLIDYTINEQPNRASIFLLDYSARERLALIITAAPKDLEAARDEAIRSMFSWAPQ